jgi:hypothetical protein
MKTAVVTFDGFNEIDSIVAAHILNRVHLLHGGSSEVAEETKHHNSRQ